MVGWRITLWAVLVVAALCFLYLVRGVLLPFVVAAILSSMLDPAVRKLRMRGLSRSKAVSLIMSAFLVGATGLTVIFAPTAIRQISTVTSQAENLTRTLAETNQTDNFFLRWNPEIQVSEESSMGGQVDSLLETYGDTLEKFGIPSTRRGLMEKYVEPNRGEIVKFIESAVHSFFGILSSLPAIIGLVFLTPILTWMILLDVENFKRRSPRWIPPAIRDQTMQIFDDIGQVFLRYLRGISSLVLLYSLAQTIWMIIMGVPYAMLLGAIFGVLYLIPFFGNIISAITVLLVVGFSEVHSNGLFHFANIGSLPPSWSYALVVMGGYLLIGFSFDHMVYPNLVGNSVGLTPFVSVFVIFCGDALFGLPGMIVAFPLAGSIKVVLDRLINVTSTGPDTLHLPSVPLRHRSTG